MAVRNYTLSGITEDGVSQSIVPGYEGLDFFCIKERVVVGSAAVQFTLNQKFPKRAKCMGYAIKCQAAATVTTTMTRSRCDSNGSVAVSVVVTRRV